MRDLLRRRPSAALVVAVIALVVATTGTAVAASQLVNGDHLIRKNSLSGNRLHDHTLTGLQIKLSELGTVPTAKNAEELGGKPASSYGGGGAGEIGTNGVDKTAGSMNGTTVTLFTSGPFKVTMICTDDGTNTSSEIDASSSEDQSDLNGTFADANTPTDTGADVEPTPDGTPGSLFAPTPIALVAPSGASVFVTGMAGVGSFGTGCWADFTGVH
jgi:hypothetical protein